MRKCHSFGLPLIGATVAALITAQAPQMAAAQTTAPTTSQTTAQPTPPANAPSVAPATPAPASAAPATTGNSPAASGEKTAGQPPVPAAAAEAPPKPQPLPPTLIARINLTTQTMVVQAGSKTIHSWKVSSGAPGYATPPGTFKPTWMSKMHYSKQYDDAPMPHSVFFNGGIAVHGTGSIHNLGRAASHGCVRLAPSNAARFFSLVNSHGMARTRIIVHGKQPFSAESERIARLNKSRPARQARSNASQQWFIASNGTPVQMQRAQRSNVYALNSNGGPRRPAVTRSPSPYWTPY